MPPSDTPARPVSLRAYAKRRGCSHEAVRGAIDDGRLSRSVVFVAGEPKIADPDLADQEWKENTRAKTGGSMADLALDEVLRQHAEAQADVPDERISYIEAHRRREVELWRQARIKRQADELELAKLQGEVVSADEVRDTVIDAYGVVKTKLLGVPARVKQRLPHVSQEDVRVIAGLIREALEELADGGAED